MKRIVIINKSDSTGGAAIVSRRLMEALRDAGADARMLVVEKLTDSPFVETAASHRRSMMPFILERLRIFLANGLNRSTLFKIDTASDGLPLWEHPLVKNADAILLNWVNQGMLSVNGIRKILKTGKPVIWTMHDMWCMTGICHHAGECHGFEKECGDCPLLNSRKHNDLSHSVWEKKKRLYSGFSNLSFVAVSNWLAHKGRESSLLKTERIGVIPNAFTIPERHIESPRNPAYPTTLLFAAARIDDDIKGLPVFIKMTKILAEQGKTGGIDFRVVFMGQVKNPDALDGMALPYECLGVVKGESGLRQVYERCDIVVSASSYETLPGTLVEGQAYGCIPVSFNRGGQSDIVDQLRTGYIAEYSEDTTVAASRLADGVAWAASVCTDPVKRKQILAEMRRSVEERFSPRAVAGKYLEALGFRFQA